MTLTQATIMTVASPNPSSSLIAVTAGRAAERVALSIACWLDKASASTRCISAVLSGDGVAIVPPLEVVVRPINEGDVVDDDYKYQGTIAMMQSISLTNKFSSLFVI
jgi:hypothetical protein